VKRQAVLMLGVAPLMVAAIALNAMADYEAADHISAAKAAEAEYHSLCEKWAAASDRGENTAGIEKAMTAAHSRFREEVRKTRYRDSVSAVAFLPSTVSAAGHFTCDDGTTYSFAIGGDDQTLAMWVWARQEWTADQVPYNNYLGLIIIPRNEGVGVLKIGRAIRQGEGSKTVFRVPYTLADISGNVEFRVADFSVHPDRGTVDRGHGWHPKAPARQPAEERSSTSGR
jgi:hypothetical protein